MTPQQEHEWARLNKRIHQLRTELGSHTLPVFRIKRPHRMPRRTFVRRREELRRVELKAEKLLGEIVHS